MEQTRELEAKRRAALLAEQELDKKTLQLEPKKSRKGTLSTHTIQSLGISKPLAEYRVEELKKLCTLCHKNVKGRRHPSIL